MENIIKIRDTFHIAVMLTEHDMSGLAASEGICVLNFGRSCHGHGGDPGQPPR